MDDLNIGAKVQEYRAMRGLSLRELSAKCGTTPSMLSQIENGAVNPSINTLKNIAEALGCPIYKFFKEDKTPEQLIVRKGNYKFIGQAGQEIVYNLLTPDVSGMIEFCLMEIPSGKSSFEQAHGHTGEETAYVISGETDVYVGGETYHLNEGDAIRIPSMIPHRWINTSEKEVKIIFAVTPPSF